MNHTHSPYAITLQKEFGMDHGLFSIKLPNLCIKIIHIKN